jgi:hypothetical protein
LILELKIIIEANGYDGLFHILLKLDLGIMESEVDKT